MAGRAHYRQTRYDRNLEMEVHEVIVRGDNLPGGFQELKGFILKKTPLITREIYGRSGTAEAGARCRLLPRLILRSNSGHSGRCGSGSFQY